MSCKSAEIAYSPDAWRAPPAGVDAELDGFSTCATGREVIIRDFVKDVVIPKYKEIRKAMREPHGDSNATELDGMRHIACLYEQFFKRLDEDPCVFTKVFSIEKCVKHYKDRYPIVGYKYDCNPNIVTLYVDWDRHGVPLKGLPVDGATLVDRFRGYDVEVVLVRTKSVK